MMSKSGPRSEIPYLDELQFELVYKRLYPRLYNYSFQFVKSRQIAQDLVHEVFLKLWEHRFSNESNSIEALLFKMTRNMCLNVLKHQRIVQNVQFDLVAITRWEELYRVEFVRDEPRLLLEQELENEINEIMNGLPERCREVFILSRMQGLKNRQIAEELNLSVKTVEKHISNALRIFRHKFLPVDSS